MIRRVPVPAQALHARYQLEGAYVDCYVDSIRRPVTQAQFVEAFYTTWLFRLERWILASLADKPSSDEQAGEIARGERADFAAWTEEARTVDQLLMCDYLGATRSWFMVTPQADGRSTVLHFGSAVTSRRAVYRALLGFHRLYSRALLAAARTKLRTQLPLKA